MRNRVMNDDRTNEMDNHESESRSERAEADLFGLRRRGGKRKTCRFCADPNLVIDYKDPGNLKYFITERGNWSLDASVATARTTKGSFL